MKLECIIILFLENFFPPEIKTKKLHFSRFLSKILTFCCRGPSGIPDFGGYSDTDSQVLLGYLQVESLNRKLELFAAD